MVEAHAAHEADLDPLATALARAFHDDPVMTWLFGERDGSRRARLGRYFRHEARRRHRGAGEVLTTPGNEGAALWDRPDRWKASWGDLARALPVMLPALGPRLPRSLRGLEKIERAHPRAPHWYLAVVGTDPVHQGHGVGRALIEPMLERCDAGALGAFLESSKPENIPYYERFGFTVTGEVDLPHGPRLWTMWRNPADRDPAAAPAPDPGV